MIYTVGSICSGIEAASVAWNPINMKFEWFSEISDFPSLVLTERYPKIKNIGDMRNVPQKILTEEISAPDIICGGTPCQAFSLAGCKNGLNDERGNLTIKFIDIVEANDIKRISKGKKQSIIFWENVEGVLTDKTNAFGCLVCNLAGFKDTINLKRWPNAGTIHGPKRNIAWRILDAKFFGLPQQRKRLYLIAGGKDYFPENILFEKHLNELEKFPVYDLTFEKEDHQFEIFREYTDCLYSAYGTKWNGNAAAYNGSLFIVQDNRIRRFSPLECERLMGFPDNYTNIPNAKNTNRYRAIGNSWAVPVIQWIGKRIIEYSEDFLKLEEKKYKFAENIIDIPNQGFFINLGKGIIDIGLNHQINCTPTPEFCEFRHIKEIVSSDAPENIYISPTGCRGILQRKQKRNIKMNKHLEEILSSTCLLD